MARIKDSSVEAVKNAAEILPIVEDYVRLRKAGGTYIASSQVLMGAFSGANRIPLRAKVLLKEPSKTVLRGFSGRCAAERSSAAR